MLIERLAAILFIGLIIGCSEQAYEINSKAEKVTAINATLDDLYIGFIEGDNGSPVSKEVFESLWNKGDRCFSTSTGRKVCNFQPSEEHLAQQRKINTEINSFVKAP